MPFFQVLKQFTLPAFEGIIRLQQFIGLDA